MFEYKYRTLGMIPRCVRYISQFRVPRSDCARAPPPRKLREARTCAHRDRGLVLGVYRNELVAPQAVLTAAAQRYDARAGGRLSKLLELAPAPALGEARVFFDVDPEYAFVALCGLGSECLTVNAAEQRDEGREAVRAAAGAGARALQALRASAVHVESFGDAEAAAEGAALALWEFREYRSVGRAGPQPAPELRLHDDCDHDGWTTGKLKAESQNLARFLQEMPANLLNPTSFAQIAVELLCELDINVEVRTQGWAAAREMGGLAAVGRSSVQPPLFVELSYFGAGGARPVVLIGKGVTFDSGGLELRPRAQLRRMRGDVAGAAVVLAATRAAARLRLPVNIRALLPLCEVMPNGASPKCGDMVCNASGQSVHVRRPSLEGRLLVADSLVYARNYWPRFIVDVGTMSPELVHTLGEAACACYCNSEELFAYAASAGARSGDRVWRMPLWRAFEAAVRDCEAADVANAAVRRRAESAVCAAFLRRFVRDTQWLHLDTFGVAHAARDAAYLRRGMTGRPTRTLLELLLQMLADSKL